MSDDGFRFCDRLGPEQVIHLYRPSIGLKGILVVDNTATGPAIGGCRIGADVTVDECFRLARAMTLKNAAAALPHGGAKSVIVGDPHMPEAEREQIVRAFACAIADVTDYIIGPDMGTDERAMAWCREEIGRAVGLPAEIGGIPLDEIGATGFGLAIAAEVAERFGGVSIDGARIAVQGFGAVGRHVARFLVERGAILVAAGDSTGTVHHAAGLDVEALTRYKRDGNRFADFDGGEHLDRDAVVAVDCDIFIPAARPDVLRADNVDRLRARLVLQGANIPATTEAEQRLHERGILNVPDFIANAGGVICAAVEYRGGTRATAMAAIEEKIRANTAAVLERARDGGVLPRQAAVELAGERVRSAMSLRRW